MLSIYKRELKTYFFSPLAYVLAGVYTLILALTFLGDVIGSRGPAQILFGGELYNLGFLLAFVIPILTMRVFAEERKNGTEVLLMTSPNGVVGIVIGKYLAAVTVFMLMTAVTAIFPIIIAISGDLNVPSMITSYAGQFLMGALFVAFGLFASSLTENQIVAAVIGSVGLFFVWLINYFKVLFSDHLLDLANWISFYNRFLQFVQGILNLKDLVFFFSLIGMFLVLTMLIIEKRRWSQG